jgi:hypothetical protein
MGGLWGFALLLFIRVLRLALHLFRDLWDEPVVQSCSFHNQTTFLNDCVQTAFFVACHVNHVGQYPSHSTLSFCTLANFVFQLCIKEKEQTTRYEKHGWLLADILIEKKRFGLRRMETGGGKCRSPVAPAPQRSQR